MKVTQEYCLFISEEYKRKRDELKHHLDLLVIYPRYICVCFEIAIVTEKGINML